MALATTRQRRPLPTTSSQTSEPSSSDRYSKEDKKTDKKDGDQGLSWFLAIIALGFFRHMSASSNIVHDCDEVFNYWEPLHYLIYKSGFQTWEYSSQFALRSYLYLFFHALVAAPASWLFEEKVRVFYAVRLLLGFISTITEGALVVAISRKYGKRLGAYALALLCLTSGCFFASTSFLPSSFSMYAVALSSAFFLFEKYALAVSVAAAGVILGWPFSILVFLPVTIASLSYGKFKQVFLSGFGTSLFTLVLSIITDHYCYGKWTSSVINLLIYNVVGGGDSHLYGTEGPLFYVRNAFNNFNFGFIFALLFLAIIPISRKKFAPHLLVVVSPMYIWLIFMSLPPHKEERFLYPIYPLICIAAAAVIDSIPDLFRDEYSTEDSMLTKIAILFRPVFLGLILCVSHSRTFSILNGYSAPMEIYKHLEHHEDVGNGSILCVGSEWHRFPSSFFVPSYISEVRWIDDGFRGLLPIPFNSTLGGTTSAPPYFNNQNKASVDQFLYDIDACTLFVELDLKRPFPARGSDLSKWETLAALPYLDREMSPPLYRSFFIPNLWLRNNVFGLYKLLKRIPNHEHGHLT